MSHGPTAAATLPNPAWLASLPRPGVSRERLKILFAAVVAALVDPLTPHALLGAAALVLLLAATVARERG